MGTFKKGLFLGSLIGAGMVWLNTSKKGKEMRKQMLDYAEDVYNDVKEKIMTSDKYKNLTKSKYYMMVEEAVNTYAVENGLLDSMRDMIERVVKAQWKNVKKK